ncbi:MAG: S8 family peptidase, partial [Candidatus Poribacteria bacterium]
LYKIKNYTIIKHTFKIVPAIAADVPNQKLAHLKTKKNVVRIEPDVEIMAVDTELDNTWGVKRIGAGFVHDANKFGTGIKVAIIDSGIDYNHPDLNDNFEIGLKGYDFFNNDNNPMDDNGHGTHVAGTVAAEDNNSGVVGVAPKAKLYALKVLGANGSGNYGDVIAALQWCVNNGIQVTNNSYGSSADPGFTVHDAFDAAYTAGIINIAAAGNSGNRKGTGDNVIYPAKYNTVVAVAATDSSNKRATFSSTGPKVELSAPGVSIKSTIPGGGYAIYSGTSMASPHVAGTAALVIASGVIGPANIRAQLQATADNLGTPGRDSLYGYGLVDADGAVLGTGLAPPRNLAGSSSNPYTTWGAIKNSY